MALTWAELQRAMPSIAAGADYIVGESGLRVAAGAGQVSITLESRPARKLGQLCIPVTHVSLCFSDMAESEQQLFLRRFERVLQRGGG